MFLIILLIAMLMIFLSMVVAVIGSIDIAICLLLKIFKSKDFNKKQLIAYLNWVIVVCLYAASQFGYMGTNTPGGLGGVWPGIITGVFAVLYIIFRYKSQSLKNV